MLMQEEQSQHKMTMKKYYESNIHLVASMVSN